MIACVGCRSMSAQPAWTWMSHPAVGIETHASQHHSRRISRLMAPTRSLSYLFDDVHATPAGGSVAHPSSPACPSPQGMPHKFYHGKTGRVWNVTKRAVGVELLKQVNGRYIKKRLHVRVEHVKPSRCHEAFLRRCKENDDARHKAHLAGEAVPVTKRQPKGPRTEGFMLENVSMETITAIPYDILKEGVQM